MSMEVDEDPVPSLPRAPLLPPAPPQYTLAIADAVIFYSPDDGDMVDDFHDRTIKAMEEAGCPVTMYLHDHIRDQGTELQSVSKVCDIAVQHWFYITDNFCRDKTMMLHKDEQIMNSLMNNNSFIPIWTKPKEEFSDLPYGIKAYTGLYETDFPRFVRRVKSMFRRRDHQDMKQAIQEKQRMEKEQWEKEETVRTTEKNRLLKEQHEKRMEDIRMAVRASLPPDRSLPRTDEEWTYQYGLQQQKHTPRRQRSSPTAAGTVMNSSLVMKIVTWMQLLYGFRFEFAACPPVLNQ